MNSSKIRLRSFPAICGIVAVCVWCIWLTILGPGNAAATILQNWPVAVAMVFGSFIAGATSEGGGAVAVPVFTKLLHIAPIDAKLFSLAIQSVGMTSAALTIILLRVPVEWRAIIWASIGGFLGVHFGLRYIAPLVPPAETKALFSSLQASFAVVLFLTSRKQMAVSDQSVAANNTTRIQLVAVGLFGGVASGLVGSGIDLMVFSMLVLYFRISEKIATPTSVVLMAINSIAGVVCYELQAGKLPDQVYMMWIAAIPIVVVGAPAGAYVCSLLDRGTIARILLTLITIEVTTTLLILPKTVSVVGIGLVATSFFTVAYLSMARYHDARI